MEQVRQQILVVDDEGIIALDLQQKLRHLGYDVPAIAHSGEQALARVAELRPDLVLMDINMSGVMDGIEAAERIREQDGPPVVFLTAYADAETLRRARLTEPYGYIIKPFTDSELHIAVEIAIHTSGTTRLLRHGLRQQATLSEFSQFALRELNLDILLSDATDRVTEALKVDGCLIVQASHDRATPAIRSATGCLVGIPGQELDAADLSAIVTSTMAAPGPLALADLRQDDRYSELSMVRTLGIVSGLTVAIRDSEGSFGVLGVYMREERVFTFDEVYFVQAISNVISQAIQRRRAEAGLRQAREDAAERQRVAKERLDLLRREQEARQEAEAANRAKDEFLAVVSHELRTPLHNILGWVSLITMGKADTDTIAQAKTIIERNTHLQVQLIEDILDVTRINAGKLKLEFQSTDLTSAVSAAVAAERPAAEVNDLRLNVVLPSSPLLVWGDDTRLQQIVSNLLDNAIKFTPSGGQIAVRLERSGPSAHITVHDTGVGISPEFMPHIFERFRQADSSSTRQHGGLGLGLSIVRHLVEAHGGTVNVTSDGQGAGATFQISLPLLTPATSLAGADALRPGATSAPSESTPAELAQGVHTAASRLAGLRVLVVDDDPGSSALMAKILELDGAEVHAANSAADALTMLKNWWPDVLVSDLAMPGQDGPALIRQVRTEGARGSHLAAIAVTANARVRDRELALAAGFQRHLVKPVSPHDLVATVAEMAARSPGD